MVFAKQRHAEEIADLRAHGDDGGWIDGELAHGVGGAGALLVERRALGDREQAERLGEGSGVLEELAEFRDGSGGHEAEGVAKGPPAGLLGAEWVNRDVRKAEGQCHLFEEAGALLEGFDEMDGGTGADDGDHEAGIAAAGADVGKRGERPAPSFLGDAEDFQGFGVVAADRVFGADGRGAGTVAGGFEEVEMADEKGKPASGRGEGGEEAGEVVPLEKHGDSGAQ